MKVYIESNFVLELALLQEQNESCENILSLGEILLRLNTKNCIN